MSILSNRSAMVLFHDDIGHRSQKVRIVIAEKGISCNLEVLTKDDLPKEILEINPDHNIIKKLNKIKDTDKDALNDASFLLFDQAKMVEGELPNDIAKFNQRMSKFLGKALS